MTRSTARSALSGIALSVLLSGPAAGQAAGFHLFDDDSSRAWARLQAVTRADDHAPDPAAVSAPVFSPAVSDIFLPRPIDTPSMAPAPGEKKHFWVAAAEVFGVNVGVWAWDRYIVKAPWAYISLPVWKMNLQEGWHWDNDDFQTTQGLHPFHGSIYFNAGRSNGYDFWESALFTVAGSLMWELFGEKQAPATNDLINTSLAGVTHGEIAYRISTMILDNTASGGTRLLREVGAFVVNPIRGFNRLFRGEMTQDSPNPEDRFPASYLVELDLGYEHLGYGYGSPDVVQYPNQSLISVLVRYGDPFLGENRRPFDFFEALAEAGPPAGKIIGRRWVERGQLVSWQLSESSSIGQRLGIFMNFDYVNDQALIFSAQSFSVNYMARFPMGHGVDVRAEAAGIFFPLTAVQSDYITSGFAAVARPFDFGLGGGAFVLARIQRQSLDLFQLGYKVVWSKDENGVSIHSTIQSLHAEGRLPMTDGLALGGGCNWDKRITSYASLPTVAVQGPQWRVFAAFLVR